MSTFPRDYPIELLRGVRRLTPKKTRDALAKRCAYVVGRITEAKALRKDGVEGGMNPKGYMLDELAAVAQAMEAFEREQARKEASAAGDESVPEALDGSPDRH